MSTRKRIPELSAIEWTGSRAVTLYAKEGRGLCRELSWEFGMAADELYGALVASQKGHPALLGVDVRWRARRVVRRLNRAADHAAAAGVEVVKLRLQFQKEFADIINPPRKPAKTFDFKDD